MTMTARSLLLTGAVLLGTMSYLSCANATPTGGSAYFFGDSLTDCCAFGRTSNGPNWADLLAPQIGESYTATAQSDYAVGGAQSGSAIPKDFLSQIGRFSGSGTAVSPNDIAGIWIGTNDVWTSSYAATDMLDGLPVGGPIGRQPSASVLTSYIVGNIQLGINQLKADGFQNFVLLSPYDLGQAAVEPNAAAAALASQYSTALTNAESVLYTPGVNTYFVDVLGLLQRVQANPGLYGFLHTEGQDNCAASNCTSQPLSVQESYIFQDNIHLTSAFDQLIANDAARIINAGQTTVPEPASAALLLAGLAGVGLATGKRKRQSTFPRVSGKSSAASSSSP